MRPRIDSAVAEELLDTGSLASLGVIDTHGHMGGMSGIWFPNGDTDAMLRTMDRCGVELLVFAHHDAMQDSDSGNRKAQEAIDAHPGRLLGYYAVNPNYGQALRRGVESFGELRGFVGYKILASYYKTPITSDVCKPLWEHADAEKLVVLLHTWGGDEFAGWRQVREIAQAYPQVTILMGHSQCGDWDEAIALAADFEGVYCELTAAYAHNGVIRKMVDAGIEDKITFGTDLPWFDPMCGIGSVVFCRISDAARRKILRENAARIFRRWLTVPG